MRTERSQGLRMLSFSEVADCLTSHSGGGKSVLMYFCMGGLPAAQRLTWIGSLVHCAQGSGHLDHPGASVFLGRAG